MNATRNPFYQLPGGADLPGDVRVSDTADATKTAADGWAASPAAVASVKNLAERKILIKGTGNSTATFRFKLSSGSTRTTFIIFTVHQQSVVIATAVVCNLSDMAIKSTDFVSSWVGYKSFTCSKNGDTYTMTIEYSSTGVWGTLYVLPNVDITVIS